MNINDLTIGQAKELQSMFGGASQAASELPFKVGEAYLFRTVTHIDVGRVVEITGQFVTLEDASWIADTGRFYDCLKRGKSVLKEIEPYPSKCFINCAALVDSAPWESELPKEQK